MSFLELDIRTLLRALVIGNLVAMAMVFAYKTPGNHAVPMRLFVLSRLFQSVAFCLISLRGEIPLWISAHLGNPLLLSGFSLVMLAVARLCESRLRIAKPLAAWVIAGSLAFLSLGSTPTLLVLISSFVGAVIYAMGGVGLLAANRRSNILIDIAYAGICHSDIHQAKAEWEPMIPSIYPMVPGHEIVGRVSQVGDNVTKFTVGDIAGIGCFIDSCRECPACKGGVEQYCIKGSAHDI